MRIRNAYGRVPIDVPDLDEVPSEYRRRIEDLFDTWSNVVESFGAVTN